MPRAIGVLVANTLGKILSSIVTIAPEAKLGQVECLSQRNVDQVKAWNSQYPIDPEERCIHDVIAERVLDRPEAEAICAWDGSLTYRELDSMACCLAIRLGKLGVAPEVMVPLCFDKSVRGFPIPVSFGQCCVTLRTEPKLSAQS